MRLVILDRDGVINEDRMDSVKSPDELQLIKGSAEAIAKLNQANIKVAVASNQANIGRGIITVQQLQTIHQKLDAELAKHGAKIDKYYICPHPPGEPSDCRKPAPGMLFSALRDFSAKAEDTPFIGDSETDIEAAEAAGCRPILVLTGKGKSTRLSSLDPSIPSYDNLNLAVRAILEPQT